MSSNVESKKSKNQISEMFRLIVNSLKMMEVRGNCIYPYFEIMLKNEKINEYISTGRDIPENLLMDDHALSQFIKRTNLELYNFEMNRPRGKNEIADFSYVVEDYTNGNRTLVYIDISGDESVSSLDFQDFTTALKKLSNSINGHEQYTERRARIRGIMIADRKLGSNPSEKIDPNHATEYVHRDYINATPFDNMMQSQVSKMTKEEEDDFYSDPGITPNNIPTVPVEKDTFSRYLGFRPGQTVCYLREKISNEEALNVTVYFRKTT